MRKPIPPIDVESVKQQGTDKLQTQTKHVTVFSDKLQGLKYDLGVFFIQLYFSSTSYNYK